eukprot:UN26972
MADRNRKSKNKIIKVLIVGEVGMGKSTLVYNLDCNKDKKTIDGIAAEGVTKEFKPYKNCNLTGVPGSGIVLDTPGIGDDDVPPFKWIAMCEKAVDQADYIGVCCNENHPRITLGSKVMAFLMKEGVVSHNGKKRLEDSIFIIETMGQTGKKDRKKSQKGMDNVRKKFAEKCGLEKVPLIRP